MIHHTIFLQLSKGEFVRAIPHKPTRRSFIQSAIELTDLRGRALRRWLRKVAVHHLYADDLYN